MIARRHGWWFDELLAYPGTQTPDGETVAGLVMARLRDAAPIHVDVIGVGASPYDVMRGLRLQVLGVNVSNSPTRLDQTGLLLFSNLRTQLWWSMRELLDPKNNRGVQLPPDQQLLADLTTPKWRIQGKTIHVQSRDEIVERIGRSPDYASAVLLAAIETPNRADIDRTQINSGALVEREADYNPFDLVRERG